MTILLSQAQAFVQKVTGGGEPELATVAAYVNMAGHHLCSMHPWNWLMRPDAAINFVAAQSWVALPSDFGEIVAIDRTNLDGWQWVGFDELLQMRYGSQRIAAGYVGAIVYSPPGTTSAPDDPRIELFPTPSANATAALRIAYRARWNEVTTSTHALTLPGWVDLLFYEILRAVVLGIEEHDNAGAAERLAATGAGLVFQAAVRHDTAVAPDGGFLRNGVGQSMRHFDDIGEVAFPS